MEFTALDVIKLNEELIKDESYIERLKENNSPLYQRIREDVLGEFKDENILKTKDCTAFIETVNQLIQHIEIQKLRKRLSSLEMPDINLRPA